MKKEENMEGMVTDFVTPLKGRVGRKRLHQYYMCDMINVPSRNFISLGMSTGRRIYDFHLVSAPPSPCNFMTLYRLLLAGVGCLLKPEGVGSGRRETV